MSRENTSQQEARHIPGVASLVKKVHKRDQDHGNKRFKMNCAECGAASHSKAMPEVRETQREGEEGQDRSEQPVGRATTQARQSSPISDSQTSSAWSEQSLDATCHCRKDKGSFRDKDDEANAALKYKRKRLASTYFEKRRRHRIEADIETLRALMDNCDKRHSKAEVLEATIEFVKKAKELMEQMDGRPKKMEHDVKIKMEK
jgi:hypothetical protein